MPRPKKEPPAIVRFAQVIGDKGALSRLGRAGAMKLKEIRQQDRECRLAKKLESAEEMAKQANEHICPIN